MNLPGGVGVKRSRIEDAGGDGKAAGIEGGGAGNVFGGVANDDDLIGGESALGGQFHAA